MSARIVTDPDGSQWVSIDLTPEQFELLNREGALEVFERELAAAYWKKWDDDVVAMCKGVAGK